MQRRSSIQISSLIVFLSILTIIVQFTAYYFLSSNYFILGISCLISFLCCHVLLEQSFTYESCMVYSVLTLFVSLIVTLLTYLSKNNTEFPFTMTLVGISFINWLIPNFHCFLRYMLDYHSRWNNYSKFYKSTNILFFIFYIGLIIYGSFAKNAFPWAYKIATPSVNFTPFLILSAHIEDYLYGLIPISDIFAYIFSRLLIYIPYGFYCTLLLRKKPIITRLFILFLLPFLLEVVQFFVFPVRCDIDDLIYGFLGGILGGLSFLIINLIFKAISGKDFLIKNNTYRYAHSSLHF